MVQDIEIDGEEQKNLRPRFLRGPFPATLDCERKTLRVNTNGNKQVFCVAVVVFCLVLFCSFPPSHDEDVMAPHLNLLLFFRARDDVLQFKHRVMMMKTRYIHFEWNHEFRCLLPLFFCCCYCLLYYVRLFKSIKNEKKGNGRYITDA